MSPDEGTVSLVSDNLSTLRQLAMEMDQLERDIEQMEASLEQLKARHRRIQCDQLPDLMESQQITSITLGVHELALESYVNASIPAPSTIQKAPADQRMLLEERRSQAFAWLRANNHDSIIKNMVTVTIPRGQDKLAVKLLNQVQKLKLSAMRDDSVHPGTLTKFVREFLSDGGDIPFEVFNISRGQRAVLTNAKPDKKGQK